MMMQQPSTRAPNAGYVGLPTRDGLQGGLDKLILLDSLATHHSLDRQVQRLALHVCRNVGSASDQQVRAVEQFCNGIQYRREPSDIFREPLAVAGVTLDARGQPLEPGGDCDDVVLLALSLLRALSIPCEGQLFCDTQTGNAFHIRAIAYLPPNDPRFAYVFDPVFVTEAQWGLRHQAGQPNLSANKMMAAQTAMARPGRLSGLLVADEQDRQAQIVAAVAAQKSMTPTTKPPTTQPTTAPTVATPLATVKAKGDSVSLWPLVATVGILATAVWFLDRPKTRRSLAT